MALRWNISLKSTKNHCELQLKYFTRVFINKVGGQPEVDPALRSTIITIVTIIMIITIEHHHHHKLEVDPALWSIIITIVTIIMITIEYHRNHHHHPHHKPEVDSALVDAGIAGVDVVQHKAARFALTSK